MHTTLTQDVTRSTTPPAHTKTRAVDLSDYNFPVELQDIYTKSGQRIAKSRAVVRTDLDEAISIVSNRYNLVPHARVIDAFAPLMTKKLGTPEVHHALEKGGARLITQYTFKNISLTIPGHRIPGQPRVGDVVALRAYGINSYNMTTPIQIKLGALVLRCLNGAMAMRGMFELKHRHVGSSLDLTLPTSDEIYSAFEGSVRLWGQWAEQGVTRTHIKTLLEKSITDGLIAKQVFERNKSDNEDRFFGSESVWDLYNAFTHIITHQSTRIQRSGKLNRFEHLNSIFTQAFGQRQGEPVA